MAIRVKCDGCAKVYSLKDSFAGKRIRCPACKAPVLVPGPAGGGAKTGAGAGSAGSGRAGTKNPAIKPPPRKTPPAAKTRPPTRPPQSRPKKSLVQSSEDMDPNATAYTPSPVRKTSGRGQLKTATVCPNCGTAMKSTQVTCGNCGYHIKLKRRMRITEAIKKTDRAPGIRADGTRYLTRGEKADIRVEQARKIRWGMFILAVLAVLLVVVATLTIKYYAENGPSLATQRLMVLPQIYHPTDADGKPNPAYDPNRPLTDLSCFHPYCVGMLVKCTIPLTRIHWEKRVPKTEIKGEKAASKMAMLCELPYFKTRSKVKMPRVQERICEECESFGPGDLARGVMFMDDAVVIWRQAGEPEKRGYLTGALLDFGNRQDELKKILLRRKDAKLAITGRLSFIISRIGDMREGAYAGTMRQSLRLQEKLDRIPPGLAGFKARDGAGERDDKLMFHPVIIVDSFNVVK